MRDLQFDGSCKSMCSFQWPRTAALSQDVRKKNRLNVNPEIPVRKGGAADTHTHMHRTHSTQHSKHTKIQRQTRKKLYLYVQSHVHNVQHQMLMLRIAEQLRRQQQRQRLLVLPKPKLQRLLFRPTQCGFFAGAAVAIAAAATASAHVIYCNFHTSSSHSQFSINQLYLGQGKSRAIQSIPISYYFNPRYAGITRRRSEQEKEREVGEGDRRTEPIPMLDTASSSRLQSLPYLLLLISFSVRIYANAAAATASCNNFVSWAKHFPLLCFFFEFFFFFCFVTAAFPWFWRSMSESFP